MAILNVTPDSFSDSGEIWGTHTVDQACAIATAAIRDGATMLDVGGESTRPGAQRVDIDEQIQRVVPVIRTIRARVSEDVLISVDTTRAKVAQAAIEAGADAVNDVSAGLEDEQMFPLLAQCGAGAVLMHRLAEPERDSYSDQYECKPVYKDVVADVKTFLLERAHAALSAGVKDAQLMLDPGLGFGKTPEQNMELIWRTGELAELGYPVLSALSRKSFVGWAMGLNPNSNPKDRVSGTVALSVMHWLAGASVFRVHDVLAVGRGLAAACRCQYHGTSVFV